METGEIAAKVVLGESEPYHFQCAAKDATEDIAEPKLILRSSVVRELHEICEWVLVKNQ